MGVAGSSPEGAPLRVSREHLVFAASSPDAAFVATHARELREGDWISRVSCNGDLSRVKIASVSKTTEQGLYAPLSQCGTVVVDGILCSCYADSHIPTWLRNFVSTHGIAQGALLPLRLASLLGWGPARGTQTKEGIHPYCQTLMNLQEITAPVVVA